MRLVLCLFLVVPAFAAPSPEAVPELASVDTWIVGGREVFPPGKWPWQGSLQVRGVGDNWSHNCGCVLISPQYALTAAHCADGYDPNNLRMTFGAHDIETRLDGQPEDVMLLNHVVHPGWINSGPQGFPNDIAVLNLTTPIDVDANDFIDVAIMAESSGPDYAGEVCFISGWGRTSGSGALANILREVEIDVLTNVECEEHWRTGINPGHVCLYDTVNQGTGSCNGDSGGPLQCDMGAQWDLVGLTSWGATGCLTTSPSVYTRVSYYRYWVDGVIGTP